MTELGVDDLREALDTDDVGQKRYLMYQVFDRLLERVYELKDQELEDVTKRVKTLRSFDGYMYKLAQEFLTSSSTMEKEKKLEKMVEHVERQE